MSNLRRVERGESLHFTIAYVEVEAARVSGRQGIIGVGPSNRIVAASVQNQQHLGHADLFNSVFDLRDIDGGLFEQFDIVTDLGVGGQQKRLAASFDTVSREREKQQTIGRNNRCHIRETPQNVAASWLSLGRLIRSEQGHLLAGKTGILDERISECLRVVTGATKRRNLGVRVLVDTDNDGVALADRRQRFDLLVRYCQSTITGLRPGEGGGQTDEDERRDS